MVYWSVEGHAKRCCCSNRLLQPDGAIGVIQIRIVVEAFHFGVSINRHGYDELREHDCSLLGIHNFAEFGVRFGAEMESIGQAVWSAFPSLFLQGKLTLYT
jgi:hypothetical protein